MRYSYSFLLGSCLSVNLYRAEPTLNKFTIPIAENENLLCDLSQTVLNEIDRLTININYSIETKASLLPSK